MAAIDKDKESNPDMSLKLEVYMDYVKDREAKLSGVLPETEEQKKAAVAPKILHREENKKKAEPVQTITKPYTARGGGWEAVVTTLVHIL